MAKKKTAVSYEVLIPCRDDKTGAVFEPGDTVTAVDFPASVIKNWLASIPPVLRKKDDGSDAKR